MERAAPLLIVGGGIGGVACALSLAQRGLAVHVLEQAEELSEIGAGIQLAPNALRVLDSLGVLEKIYVNAVFPRRAVMRDARSARELTVLSFDETFVQRFGYPYIVTHRSDLHLSLLEACRGNELVTLETGACIQTVADDGERSVVVTTVDGRRYAARAVIGADGLHSTVRRFVAGTDALVYAKDVAYRGTVEYDSFRFLPRDHEVTWWVGPRIHLIQYPVRRGRVLNQVAVFTSERYQQDSSDWGTPDELDRLFADTHQLVRQGVSRISRDRRWIMVDRDPISSWSRGPVTLIGDAAHPMLQYLAQGACQALEDAYVLGLALAQLAGRAKQAFEIYEQVRVRRTAEIQGWARQMGEIVHADGVTARLRDALLAVRGGDDLTYFDWLYGYRAEDALASHRPYRQNAAGAHEEAVR